MPDKSKEDQPGEDAKLEPVAESEPPAPDLEALQEEVTALRALLTHISGGTIDIDEELDNVALKRDGTVINLSSWKPAVKVTAGEPPPARKPVRQARPAETRGAASLRASAQSLDDTQLMAALSSGGGMKQFHEEGD